MIGYFGNVSVIKSTCVPSRRSRDPPIPPGVDERPVRQLTEQNATRVNRRLDVLRHDKVDHPVVVDVYRSGLISGRAVHAAVARPI